MINLNFDPFPVLTTGRLTLRQLTTDDAPEIFMLRSDEAVNEFLDRKKAIHIDDAIQFISTINKNIAKNEAMYWGIQFKDEGRLIGTLCYWNINKEKGSAEIGYELLPAFQGKGIMQEAIQRAIRFGFENMQLEMITAFSHQKHQQSIKLLDKNNFTKNIMPGQEKLSEPNDYCRYVLKRPTQ